MTNRSAAGCQVDRSAGASELDLRPDDHRALAWQPEIVGGLGGDHRGGDEELLSPAAHPRLVAGPELDLGEEIGRRVDLERALDPGLLDEPDHGRHVELLEVAVPCAYEGDAVVLVAQLVDVESLRVANTGDRNGL